MVGEIVHGGLGDRTHHREVKDDAQDHHHQVEHGEGDRPAGLKSFRLELVLEISHFWSYVLPEGETVCQTHLVLQSSTSLLLFH